MELRMESHPTTVRRRPWTGVVLVGAVMIGLAAAFFLLEQQRRKKLTADCVRLRRSIDGEVVAATFLVKSVTADQLDFIAQYPRIESVSFSNTRSVDGGLQRLRRFDRLKSLDLSRTDWLDATVLKDVADLPHLRYVSLADSNVSDAALSQLTASQSLETLALDDCEGITDASIDTLQQVATLREVRIEGTRLTLRGFRRLRVSRQDLVIDCKVAQFLDVRQWGSPATETFQVLESSASAEDLAVLLELRHDWTTGRSGPPITFPDVRRLELSGPSPVKSMALLAPRLSELHSLVIPAPALTELEAAQVAPVYSVVLTGVTPGDDLRLLQRMPQLQYLRLEPTSSLSDDAVQLLSTLHRIEAIGLQSPGLSDPLCAALSQLPALESVSVTVTSPLPPDALQCLVRLPNLTSIGVQPAGITTELIHSLPEITTLRHLGLELTSPLDSDAVQKLNSLPHLRSLSLEGPGVDDALVAALAKLSALESLTIRSAPVGDAGVAPFLERLAPTYIRFEETHVSSQMSSLLSKVWQDSRSKDLRIAR
jgi:hypothetical protein